MRIRLLKKSLLGFIVAVQPFFVLATGSSVSTNSNLWPVHRDIEFGYRISYPSDWQFAPTRGANIRFSIVPPEPPGNCNLVVIRKPELAGMDQATLNTEVQSLGLDAKDWANYVGISQNNIRLMQVRRASVDGVAAIIGVLETDIENLQGKFMRKQNVVLMLHRGSIWTLNCGASDSDPKAVRKRYDQFSSTMSKIIGSFGFLAATTAASPVLGESLSDAQIKQIEQIAQDIATQHNASPAAMLDDVTASSIATAVGRNVLIQNVLRVRKGLPPAKLKEFADETKGDVLPKACAANAKNPAFARGLSYTFSYVSTYGEKLAEFTVDQRSCKGYR